MGYSSLVAGDLSPIPSLLIPDTWANSFLSDDGLVVPIFVVSGTGFERDAVSDGQIDIAIERQGPMTFFLLRFLTPAKICYLMAPFDALNTPSDMSIVRVMKQFSSSDGVALRIWTQDESGIIQTVRHTRLPANLQSALMLIVRRQMKKGKCVDLHKGSGLMRRFLERTGRASSAFDNADIKGRVT